MTCRYYVIRHSMFCVIPHGMLPVQCDLSQTADRLAAVSGLALRRGMKCSLLEKFCITIRPLATVISEKLFVHSLISTLKRGNQFMQHILLLIALRGSCRNDRLSEAQFAFCLNIDTKGGCTIYCRSFSSLKCPEVLKSAETCVLKPKKRQSSLLSLNFYVGKKGRSNIAFTFQC